jgi:hypothetical protein
MEYENITQSVLFNYALLAALMFWGENMTSYLKIATVR